jgi:integrase
MTRGINRLPGSYAKLKPGMHADGGGLYLQVTIGAKGNRRASWIFRYQLAGAFHEMGLGSAIDISLADARETARGCRIMKRDGLDPLAARRAMVAGNIATTAKAMTFDEASAIYIRLHSPAWKNVKHASQWSATLQTYASPIIGKMPLAAIDTATVLRALEPIWLIKPETAGRVRGRIESILGWATVSGHRTGENPARWKGHLANLLPALCKVRAVVHQAALAPADVAGFIAELRQREGFAALELEFAILTCVRSADVRHARLADIVGAMWTIPAMTKTRREHRVPLSAPALAVIAKARSMSTAIGGKVAASGLLFPNDCTGAALSGNAMLEVISRMGRKGTVTTHGFRASFRTWALESTSFSWELAELSLGHTVGSKVERAYQRGDGFQKRIAIMDSWAAYCDRPREGNVVSIARASK